MSGPQHQLPVVGVHRIPPGPGRAHESGAPPPPLWGYKIVAVIVCIIIVTGAVPLGLQPLLSPHVLRHGRQICVVLLAEEVLGMTVLHLLRLPNQPLLLCGSEHPGSLPVRKSLSPSLGDSLFRPLHRRGELVFIQFQHELVPLVLVLAAHQWQLIFRDPVLLHQRALSNQLFNSPLIHVIGPNGTRDLAFHEHFLDFLLGHVRAARGFFKFQFRVLHPSVGLEERSRESRPRLGEITLLGGIITLRSARAGGKSDRA